MRLVRDAALVGVSHIGAALCIVGAQVALARQLRPDVFGSLLLAHSLALLTEGLIVARAGEVATFVLGRSWSRAPGQVAASVRDLRRREWVWGLGALAVLALASPILEWMFAVPAYCYVAFGTAIALQSGFGTSKALFIVANRIRVQAWFELAYSALSLVAIAVGVWAGGMDGFLAAVGVSAVAKGEAARRVTNRWVPVGDAAMAQAAAPTIGLSASSLLRNACNSVAAQGDVLILGLLAPKEVVALYKVSRTVAALPGRAAAPVWAVLRPRFVRYLGDGTLGPLKRDAAKAALAFALIGFAAAPLAWAWCAPVLESIYGAPYGAAATITLTLLFGNWVLAGVTGWLGTIAIMSTDKRVTVGIYAMLAVLICAGAALAGGDGERTAMVVAASMVATAAFAWTWLGVTQR